MPSLKKHQCKEGETQAKKRLNHCVRLVRSAHMNSMWRWMWSKRVLLVDVGASSFVSSTACIVPSHNYKKRYSDIFPVLYRRGIVSGEHSKWTLSDSYSSAAEPPPRWNVFQRMEPIWEITFGLMRSNFIGNGQNLHFHWFVIFQIFSLQDLDHGT